MKLPITRYYGSKRRHIDKIWQALIERNLQFDSILDLFGGTGIVSYFFAQKGKEVIYNDILSFNTVIAQALMCTTKGTFQEEDALILLNKRSDLKYKHIIEDTFRGIYYNDDENRIIDIVIQNIQMLPLAQRPSAYYILFQSCLIKRPFNLFHRNNLNLRTNHTESKFGNKVTWEKTFYELFFKFTRELNEFQFEKKPKVTISNASALKCRFRADLVYIDTPYFPKKGSSMSYHSRYHFLEGLLHYELIPDLIDINKANKEIKIGKYSEFENKTTYISDLRLLFEQHKESILVMSYTTDGYPSVEILQQVMSEFKLNVEIINIADQSFALNRNNKGRQEVIILGW